MEGEDSLLYRHLLVIPPTLCWDQNAAAVLEHLSMGQSLGKKTRQLFFLQERMLNEFYDSDKSIYSDSSFPNLNHYNL